MMLEEIDISFHSNETATYNSCMKCESLREKKDRLQQCANTHNRTMVHILLAQSFFIHQKKKYMTAIAFMLYIFKVNILSIGGNYPQPPLSKIGKSRGNTAKRIGCARLRCCENTLNMVMANSTLHQFKQQFECDKLVS